MIQINDNGKNPAMDWGFAFEGTTLVIKPVYKEKPELTEYDKLENKEAQDQVEDYLNISDQLLTEQRIGSVYNTRPERLKKAAIVIGYSVLKDHARQGIDNFKSRGHEINV
ncbi:MAG: hypothetical protein FWE45_04385 [Firmicutes bacterium]|nr:hypothetical protein [Bacillota bacterium]